MEVLNVFSNKMMNFSGFTFPPIFYFFTFPITPLLSAGDVTDGSIKPHVPVIAWAVWDFKTKVWRWSRNIPVLKLIVKKIIL